MISFVIPAYNEEHCLGAALEAIGAAARAVGRPFEIIVVDDASTDRTGDVARERGARVVRVELRHIAAVRNAGARAAQGDLLFFVDADTIMPEAALRAALQALDEGAVGGGARVKLEPGQNWTLRAATAAFAAFWFGMRWAAGCFIFVRRQPFEAMGGFDERYYIGEELYLSRALKRLGRFVILREPVVTSARKLRLYGPWRLLRDSLRVLLGGSRAWRRHSGLEMWYEGRRDGRPPSGPQGRPDRGRQG